MLVRRTKIAPSSSTPPPWARPCTQRKTTPREERRFPKCCTVLTGWCWSVGCYALPVAATSPGDPRLCLTPPVKRRLLLVSGHTLPRVCDGLVGLSHSCKSERASETTDQPPAPGGTGSAGYPWRISPARTSAVTAPAQARALVGELGLVPSQNRSRTWGTTGNYERLGNVQTQGRKHARNVLAGRHAPMLSANRAPGAVAGTRPDPASANAISNRLSESMR